MFGTCSRLSDLGTTRTEPSCEGNAASLSSGCVLGWTATATAAPDARQSSRRCCTGNDMRMSPRMTRNSSASVCWAASLSAATVPCCLSSWTTWTVMPSGSSSSHKAWTWSPRCPATTSTSEISQGSSSRRCHAINEAPPTSWASFASVGSADRVPRPPASTTATAVIRRSTPGRDPQRPSARPGVTWWRSRTPRAA